MTQESASMNREPMKARFSDLDIAPALKKGIEELGYTIPTLFQQQVLDSFNRGENVIGEGLSNYGKSLAFSLPILGKIDPQKHNPQALVICDSSLQSDLCAKEYRALGRHLNIDVCTSFASDQNPPYTSAHLLVLSTDNLDQLSSGTLPTSIETIFLDNLSEDNTKTAIKAIGPEVIKNAQLLIFGQSSSSFNEEDEIKNLMEMATIISNNDQPNIIEPAKHIFYQAKDSEPKPRALLAALEANRPHSFLVTSNDYQECDLLERYLVRYGYKTLVVSEERNRQQLKEALRQLSEKQIDVLLCQSSLLSHHSLANVPYMINYDMFDRPQTYEDITQFKKQASGLRRVIINILSVREMGFLGPIKAQCLIDFTEEHLPTEDEVIELCAKRIRDGLNKEASEVELTQFEILGHKIFSDPCSYPGLSLLLRNYLTKPISTRSAEERDHRRNTRSHGENRRYDRQERQHNEISSNEHADHQSLKNSHGAGDSGDDIARLYITLGRRDGFSDLASLAQFLSERSGIDLGHFSGSGMIRDNSAHIEVDEVVAQQIIESLNQSERPNAEGNDESDEEPNLIVCERARQSSPRPYRRHNQSHRPRNKRPSNFSRR